MRALLLLLVAGVCNAQTTIYSNQYGKPVAQAQTTGNSTIYSNQYGQPIGYAMTTPPTAPVPPVPPPPPPQAQQLVPVYFPLLMEISE